MMEKDLQEILKIINDAPAEFLRQLSKTEKEIYERVLGIIKELDVDSTGKIKPSIANLKKLEDIKGHLGKSLLSKEYLNSVKGFVKKFQAISVLQKKLFDSEKPILKTITLLAIDNTLDTLTGKGYTDTVVRQLRDIIQTSITSGGSYKDLTLNIEKLVTGDNDKQSILKKQVQVPVMDALSIYSAEYTKLITEDLGYEWYEYIGSNKTTTREFCEHMTNKRYVHKSEIPTLLTGLIDGYQCKTGKNGLPLGMFDDTNIQNFQVNRGGHNCGHQLWPILESKVPQNIKKKIEGNIK